MILQGQPALPYHGGGCGVLPRHHHFPQRQIDVVAAQRRARLSVPRCSGAS